MTIEYGLLIFNLVIGILGWFMKNWINDLKSSQKLLQTKVEETTKELTSVQINYVHKSDLHELRRELLDRFDRLEERIMSK